MIDRHAGAVRRGRVSVVPRAIAAALAILVPVSARCQLAQSILPPNLDLPIQIPGYPSEPTAEVGARANPEYAPLGIRLGSFLLSPRLDQSGGYDSKVVGVRGGPGAADVITAPTVTIASDWSRNSAAATVALVNTSFPDLAHQSHTEDMISVAGRYDLGRDSATLDLSHFDSHQLPTDITALGLRQPEAFQVQDARAGYSTTLGRWSLTPQIDFTDATFDRAPGLEDARLLDHISYTAELGAAYALTPTRALLADAMAVRQDFRHRQSGVPALNATTTRLLVGVRDMLGLFTIYGLIGFERRQFDSAAYSIHQAPVGEVGITYTPTLLTTIAARLERTIEDPLNTTAIGYTYDTLRLSVQHEYSRSLLLQAGVEYNRSDALNTSEVGRSYTADVGATKALNRVIGVSANYSVAVRQDTVQQQNNFVQHVALLTVNFAL